MISLAREEFEQIVEEALEKLPQLFQSSLQNIGITVEDYPDDAAVRLLRLPSKHNLLGLYQGIPLTRRGSSYGVAPTAPDRILLFQKNIEATCSSRECLVEKIREVLIHEIGHYFGMDEKQIRAAGY